MIILYVQSVPSTNNLEQTHIRCSLHCERWTVKGRDCASALHSFKEITYRTDEWTKQLLRLKSWVISGSPEQWTEFHRLWSTVIVFKCSLQPIIEHSNLHPSQQLSGILGDVILDSYWLPTLRDNQQQCIKIDHSSTMY